MARDQKIAPFLWFDDQLDAAMELYTNAFRDAAVLERHRYEDSGAEGDMTVTTAAFRLAGRLFMGLDGGPGADPTPAISFHVGCETEAELDALHERLVEGGTVLMPLQAYPFSPRFTWINDRFGVSWQLDLTGRPQHITPSLLFVGAQAGRAEEAMAFYTRLWAEVAPEAGPSKVQEVARYAEGDPDVPGHVKQGRFLLAGDTFRAMDSSLGHDFGFTHAVSLFIDCTDQTEVDAFWGRLTDGGTEQPCGWVKDRFGVSWQVVPEALMRLLQDPEPAKAKAAMGAMLRMKKIDVAELHAAHDTA